MAGNRNQQGGERPGATHEEKDVNALAVGIFGVAMAALLIVSVLLLIGLFRYFKGQEASHQTPAEPAAETRGLPAEPHLQETPVRDLKQMRAAEDQILGSYGWVDRQKGIVRLPIGRAMELLAQRNLPYRQGTAPNSAAAGVSVPTESGLGRK
jgi:hypothetical protein